jgi:hypothetical protein
MDALKGRVENGRLVIDGPVRFPEGTVIELTVADPGDELDASERAALHESLSRAWSNAQRAPGRPADDLVRRLRSKRK